MIRFSTSRTASLATFSLLIFLVAFGFRWAHLLRQGSFNPAGYSAQEMDRVAMCWAEEGRFAHAFTDSSGDTAYLSPVYTMLLGSIYRVVGKDPYHRWIGRSFLGIFTSSLGIALMPALAAMLRFSRVVGLASGMLLALTPVFFWMETTGDWDQSTIALALIVSLMVFIRLHDCQWSSWPLVVIAGVLVGLGVLISPSIAPALALMILAELFWSRSELRQKIPKVVVLATVAVLMQVPWAVRNYRALGGIVPTRSNFGMNLWMGNNPESIGRSNTWDHSSRLSWDNPFTSQAELDELLRLGELKYNQEKSRLAMQWISQNPRRFATLTVQRFMLFWFPPVDAWVATTTFPGVRSCLLWFTALGAFCSALWLALAGNPYRWLILSALIGPSVIYYFVHVNFRYRYPIWAISVLLTCQFLWALAEVTRAYNSRVETIA